MIYSQDRFIGNFKDSGYFFLIDSELGEYKLMLPNLV